MSQIENTGKIVAEKAGSLLTGKPIWFWWIFYTVLIAVIFAVFYFAIYVLTVKWWVITILTLVTGIIWGTVAYTNQKKDEPPAAAQ